MVFNDRQHAGFLLSEVLHGYRGSGAIVLGLPRGGVTVAHEVAKNLNLLIDALVVKKIPSPRNSELAIGAVAPDDVFIIDEPLVSEVNADTTYIQSYIASLQTVITQKQYLYTKKKQTPIVQNKTVIVVDDGAATGATIKAAVLWLKKKHAAKIIVALPVAPEDVAKQIQPEVDECVILETPKDFRAVGQFYRNFEQVSDEEVVQLL